MTFNVPIPVKPITTEADSILDPRPSSGPYVPYDYSHMSFVDVIAYTIGTGGQYILIGCVFFFFVEYLAHYILRACFGKAYLKRTKAQQREDCTRVCAIVNGLISTYAAFLFFRSVVVHGYQLHNYFYQPMEGYDFNRGFITGYFIWDIIICIRYKWGVLWTIHGIFSFIGSFLLNFPVTDSMGCYFSGTFELTNGLLHGSSLLRTYNVGLGVATIFEMLFALFYLIIRVIGGTYCAYNWFAGMYILWQRGEVHSYPAVGFLAFSLGTIMILQYIWFGEIVQIALGLKKNPQGNDESKQAKKDDASDKKKIEVPAAKPAAKPARANSKGRAPSPSPKKAPTAAAVVNDERSGSVASRKKRVAKE